MRYFIVFGSSMKPDYGFFNIVWCVKPIGLKVGDVVIFTRKGKFIDVCHRIIDVYNDYYHIKGDNRCDVDCVNISNIHYKVVGFKKVF